MMNFIDFTKAFDSVHHPSLWRILKNYRFPSDFIDIIQNLYDQWRNNGVAAASRDGGPPSVPEFLMINFNVCVCCY